MYARASYITAVGFVELPYIVAQTIVFVPVAYFMVGKPHHCQHTLHGTAMQWVRRHIGW